MNSNLKLRLHNSIRNKYVYQLKNPSKNLNYMNINSNLKLRLHNNIGIKNVHQFKSREELELYELISKYDWEIPKLNNQIQIREPLVEMMYI